MQEDKKIKVIATPLYRQIWVVFPGALEGGLLTDVVRCIEIIDEYRSRTFFLAESNIPYFKFVLVPVGNQYHTVRARVIEKRGNFSGKFFQS